jgi:superfamily II DNA or RNA helicase
MRDRREQDSSFRWEDSFRIVADPKRDPQVAVDANRAIAAFRSMRKIEDQAEGKLRMLEDLFRLHAGEPVLVFVGTNVMARKISLRFLVPCLLSHCRKRERQEWLSGLAQGRYPALVANRVLDEGVDLPNVKTAIVLGGLSSQRQAIQRLGRVLRRDDKNSRAVLYEVVTNNTREVQRSRNRRRNSAYRDR